MCLVCIIELWQVFGLLQTRCTDEDERWRALSSGTLGSLCLTWAREAPGVWKAPPTPPLSIPLSLTTVSTTEPSAATPRNSTLPSVKDHSWEEVSGGGLGVRAEGESVRLREGQLEYGKAAYVNVKRNRSKKKTGNLQKEKLNFRNFTATLKFQHFTHWLTAVKTILASGKGKLWKASWWLNCSIEMHFSELWSGQLEKENKPGFLQFHAMSTT